MSVQEEQQQSNDSEVFWGLRENEQLSEANNKISPKVSESKNAIFIYRREVKKATEISYNTRTHAIY